VLNGFSTFMKWIFSRLPHSLIFFLVRYEATLFLYRLHIWVIASASILDDTMVASISDFTKFPILARVDAFKVTKTSPLLVHRNSFSIMFSWTSAESLLDPSFPVKEFSFQFDWSCAPPLAVKILLFLLFPVSSTHLYPGFSETFLLGGFIFSGSF